MSTNWGRVLPRDYGPWMLNQPKKGRSVAYCSYHKHRGNLSVELLREHDCLNKQCPYLRKDEEHPYWEQRRQRKEKAAAMKEAQRREEAARIYEQKQKYRNAQGKSDKGNQRRTSGKETNIVVAGGSIGTGLGEVLAQISFVPTPETHRIFAVNVDGDDIRVFESNGAVSEKTAKDALVKGYRVSGSPYAAIMDDHCDVLLFRFSSEAGKYVEVDGTWGRLYPQITKVIQDFGGAA